MSMDLYIVHTMGKVGTLSMSNSLKAAGLQCIPTTELLSFPQNPDALQLVDKIKNWEGRIHVVTALRDPIARNLSAYVDRYCGESDPSVEDFLDRYPQRVPLDWTGEFFHFWGVQLNRFNSIAGFSFWRGIHSSTFMRDLESVSIIQTERLTEKFQRVMFSAAMIDVPEPGNSSLNGSSRYKQFLKNLKLPPDYVDHMYRSWYSKMFFSEKQRDRWKEKWKDEST
jgi:hypothetical protein